MKSKITRGKGFRGALDYAFDVGPKATHDKDAELIGGNMCGENPRELAHEFAAVRAIRPDIEKPVWHSSLRCPAGENPSDEKWNAIAQDYMQRLGFDADKTPYCIVRHKDNHIHIVASRVNLDGGLYLGKNEHLQATRISQELEKEHGLTITKGPEYTIDEDGKERVKMPDRKKPRSKELKMMERTGELSPRMKLQNIIDEAVKDRPTAEEYEKRLEEAGVEWRKGSAGYSYSIEGKGFKGSQLGDAYKGERFKDRLDLGQELEKTPTPEREPVTIQPTAPEKTPEPAPKFADDPETQRLKADMDATAGKWAELYGDAVKLKDRITIGYEERNAALAVDREQINTAIKAERDADIEHSTTGEILSMTPAGRLVLAALKALMALQLALARQEKERAKLAYAQTKAQHDAALEEIKLEYRAIKEGLAIAEKELKKIEIAVDETTVDRYRTEVSKIMQRDVYRPLEQKVEQAEAKVETLRAERDRINKAVEQKEKSIITYGLKDLKEEKKRIDKALDDAYGDRAAAKYKYEHRYGQGGEAEAKAQATVAQKLGPEFMDEHRRASGRIEKRAAEDHARRMAEAHKRAIEHVKREQGLSKGKGRKPGKGIGE